MKKYSEILKNKFYGKDWVHPYGIYEKVILNHVKSNSVVLDAGCGKDASTLKRFDRFGLCLIGLDVCEFNRSEIKSLLYLVRSDLRAIVLKSNSIDLVISRSVFEHIENPEEMVREIHRVLKPGGHFIFLTPNVYDYASIFSAMLPNRFHACVVRLTEGRNEKDTFPTYYRFNSGRRIKKIAEKLGFEVCTLDYLGQYPSYFMFNPILFIVGTAYDKLICKTDILKNLRGWILAILKKR